jgi:amidohydrolase
MTAQLVAMAKEKLEYVRALRRELHRYPEVGADLPRTRKLVLRELRKLGLEVAEDVGGGIVADLKAGDPSRGIIALRADMDALPIQEESGLDFASEIPGQAHMCGHDAHAAMLLGAAALLTEQRDRLPAGVRFLFQPNEENQPGGARFMVEAGCLDGVCEVFGLHVWPGRPAGWFGTRPGPLMARPDIFSATVKGHGGHASVPHQCADPILAASLLVTQWNSIVSRRVDPGERAVVSVTRFEAGTSYNIIPDTAFLQGTVRTLSDATGDLVRSIMQEMAASVAAGMGVKADFDYVQGFPVVVNDPGAAARAARVLGEITELVAGNIEPAMVGEDFSYYLNEVPGCFLFMGCGVCARDGRGGLHSTCFRLDEDCLPWGVAALASLALNRD